MGFVPLAITVLKCCIFLVFMVQRLLNNKIHLSDKCMHQTLVLRPICVPEIWAKIKIDILTRNNGIDTRRQPAKGR
jgi:hypothetical protein